MDKAVKSTAVVSSLFPEAVHERLFNEGQGKSEELSKAGQNKDAWKNPNAQPAHDDDNFTEKEHRPSLTEILEAQQIPRSSTDITKKKGKPIADKLDNATVLFGKFILCQNISQERCHSPLTSAILLCS